MHRPAISSRNPPVILVDASRGVPKAGVCTEPLARDYATLPFGLLKRAIWPQMNDQLRLLHVSSVYLPVESNAVNRGVRFTLKATPLLRSSETTRSGTRRHHREVLAYQCPLFWCRFASSISAFARFRSLFPMKALARAVPNSRSDHVCPTIIVTGLASWF